MTLAVIMESLRSWFDRRGLLAIASGALIALSFPNAGLSFLAWIALIPLLIALEESSRRDAFRIGFLCGLSAYTVILYWITIVMTRYGHLPWSVSVPLYLLLAGWLSLFYGAALLVARCGETVGIKSAFSLPIAWVASDCIRLWLLSGFPWAMLGHSQYRILPIIQIADLCGVYGITALIVLANVVVYRVLRALSGATVPYPVKSALILLALTMATLIYGFNRLNPGMPTTPQTSLRIALLQGNIPQDVKWSRGFRDRTMAIYDRLSRQAAKESNASSGGRLDLLVWPESAVPFFFQDEPQQADKVRRLAQELAVSILLGSPAHESRNGQSSFFNSAYMITPDGTTAGRADKLHLVPFGEYVPWGRFFPFISKIVEGIGDFVPGETARVLPAGGIKLGTMICYEAIFPDIARRYVANGARIMVNITNDAWFGRSSAPYQHLAMAAFRAVETRTPLVRAANTGITAFVDQNGHIKTMTGLFTEDYRIVTVLPGSGESLYLRIGDLPAWLCILISASIMGIAWRRRSTT